MIALFASRAEANTGLVSLTCFPNIAVADGKSSVGVDAEVRDTNGRLAPDGTRVLFSTDLGQFRDPVVGTRGGIAHGVLVAGSIAGVATVTASAISYDAASSMKITLVADRSLLSSAKEYVEVVGSKEVRYEFEQKMLVASGSKRKAYLRYREVEIHADDLQLDVPTYEVRAKNALLKIGKFQQEFGLLYFKLNDREGYGTTSFKVNLLGVAPSGHFLAFTDLPEQETTYGIAEVSAAGVRAPKEIIAPDRFAFADTGLASTEVVAKKATAFPGKHIQFEAVSIYVDRSRVMRMPLYQLDLAGPPRLFADSIVNVNNNQLAINYPYYLSLGPGQSSMLRLTTGQSDAQGIAVNRGIFLNYEYNWNKGDDMQGGLTFQGLGRNDWGLRANQYWRMDDGSNIATMLELPSHNSLYGTLNANKQFKGYDLSADASGGKSFAGTPFNSEQFSLSLDKDPFKLGSLPFQFFVGAEAFSQASNSLGFLTGPDGSGPLLTQNIEESQTAYGLRLRGQSQPWSFGPRTNLYTSFSVAKLAGHNTLNGLTYDFSANFNHSFGPGRVLVGYDYMEDGFNSALLGRQQLSLQTDLRKGNLYFDFFGLKALDQDRTALQLDASYRLNRTWRLGYALTDQRYLGANYTDYSIVLGFRVGYKEFGLTWSQKTHHFGFQLLGTTFN